VKTNHKPPAEPFPSEEDMRLPPRRVIHSSDSKRVVRWFHASLLAMFVMLTVGIIVWYQFFAS